MAQEMKPPRCKVCGVEEWRHVCGGSGVVNAPEAVVNRVAPVVNIAVPKRVPNIPENILARLNGTERRALYRARNREACNERSREAMRRKRAQRVK